MSSATMATLSASASSQQIRSKFLSRIGLHPNPDKIANSPSSSTPTSPSSVLHGLEATAATSATTPSIPIFTPVTRPPVNITTEALKYDPLADALYSKRRRTNTRASHNKKRLVFQETVRVVPIPMRTEYSSRVRSRLWTSASELYENAARNTVEFAHEGWDWRKVTEDELMHVCVATGELIHPCHYAMLCKEQANE